MIPDASNEWVHEDDYDASAISSMAKGFKALPRTDTISSLLSAWYLTGPHPQAGWIKFCWENPVAWQTLAGDIDREWFMEQVVTRTTDIPPVFSMDEDT